MAPRGSGHSSGSVSGGDGVDSGSSDGSSSGSDSSVWLASSKFSGPEFANGDVVADIVFTGIWMVALCVIAVWAMGVERRSKASKSVLGWKKYGIAMSLFLIFYGFRFAQDIIQASGGSITNVYFLLAVIFDDVLFPATTWLLFTIYSLLFYCCINPDETKRARHRGFLRVHFILCVLTIGLWIVLLLFDLANTIGSVGRSGFNPNMVYNTWQGLIVYDLDTAFQAVLLAASIEIFLFASWLLVRAQQYGGEYYAASLYFFRLVAVPFLILRVFYLAYVAAFGSYKLSETWGAYIAFDIITGACTVVVFVGVVLVSRRLERVQLRPWDGNQNLNQPPNAYSPAPTGQTSSRYSYGPVSPISAAQTHPQKLHGQGQGIQEMPVHGIHQEKS